MNRRNTLYMQKAAIAAAVYLVLRYLLPLVFPFFFAWLTVAALNRFRHRISMRLVPLSAGVLSILFLAVLLFLLLSGYLLYPPIRELFPVWQDFLLRMTDHPHDALRLLMAVRNLSLFCLSASLCQRLESL